MTRILMVCLGNICRSPLAEGILQSKVDEALAQVESAGLHGYHAGELPDERSIQVARENKIDITNQRSRKFEVADFDKFDIIYAMDRQNYTQLLKLAPSEEEKNKVRLLLEGNYSGSAIDVPDPYYDSITAFREVFKMLDEACNQIVRSLS